MQAISCVQHAHADETRVCKGMKKEWRNRCIILIASMLSMVASCLAGGPYVLELGLQGGVNYYVGDANPYIFMHPREVYGAQLRYKIDRRWALQLKGQSGRYAFKYPVDGAGFIPKTTEQTILTNRMISIDAVGEFNFFRFGNDWNDRRNRPYTPYIFLGLGVSMYGGQREYCELALYMPFGIGFKWKFSEHCGLQLAWQNQVYFVDDLENVEEYNDIQKLNGSNFLNSDLVGNVTFGLVFDFIEAKKVCRTCDW